MKALLGLLGGIVLAGAGVLFVNLALAMSSQTLLGRDWIAFAGFYVAALALAMTAPTLRKGVKRLLVGTGLLLSGSAVLILVMGQGPITAGAVGVVGGANIAILLVVGLGMLAGGLFASDKGS